MRASRSYPVLSIVNILLVLACLISGVRKKIKLQHQSLTSSHYGHDLPTFAYDYSELLLGATIERSHSSKDLYLVVFLLNHGVIFKAGLIEAISTDQEHLLAWTAAVKKWSSEPNNTQSARSKFYCVLQHNDHSKSSAYQAPAYWLRTLSRTDMTVPSYIEVLRCKLRNTQSIYQNATYLSDKRLFVDIIKQDGAGLGAGAGAGTGGGGKREGEGAEEKRALPSSSNRTLLSSFEVRWKYRQVGYGGISLMGRDFSPWSLSNLPPVQAKNRSLLFHTPSALPSLSACVYGLHPLGRAGAGGESLARAVEYVEHLLGRGVRHVVLGIHLDQHSYTMLKYLASLSPYLLSGQLTLSPLSLSPLNDVPGLSSLGVVLSPFLSDSLFLSQCLSLSRGVSDLVVVGGVRQWLVGGQAGEAGTGEIEGEDLRDILRREAKEAKEGQEVKSNYYFARNFSSSPPISSSLLSPNFSRVSLPSRSALKGVRLRGPGAGAGAGARERGASVSTEVVCGYRVDRVWAREEPKESLFPQGDSAWTRDFYSTSPFNLLSLPSSSSILSLPPVLFLSPRHVSLFLLGEKGQVFPLCRAGGVERGLGHIEGVYYLDSLPPGLKLEAGAVEGGLGEREITSRSVSLFSRIHASLSLKNLSSLSSHMSTWKEIQREFLEREGGPAGRVVERGWGEVKEPLWRSAKERAVAEVVKSIFG